MSKLSLAIKKALDKYDNGIKENLVRMTGIILQDSLLDEIYYPINIILIKNTKQNYNSTGSKRSLTLGSFDIVV